LLLGPKKIRPQRGGELRPNLKACQEGQHPTQFWMSVCHPAAANKFHVTSGTASGHLEMCWHL
jgi:hypothetical protein